MAQAHVTIPELPNFVALAAEMTGRAAFLHRHPWLENAAFSLIAIVAVSSVALVASRRASLVPGPLQSALELLVGGIDAFVCGIIGPKGRTFTPFIGTLFVYILAMNLLSLVPLMKSPTASWSTTLALSLSVFAYLQYTAVRELGLLGYADHLLGRPRGIMAATVILPVFMLFLHIVSELIRPVSLSLRLRSNIWGDDMLLAVLAGFGLKGIPLFVFNAFLALLAAIVQACVFSLLTTIYFALVLAHEDA